MSGTFYIPGRYPAAEREARAINLQFRGKVIEARTEALVNGIRQAFVSGGTHRDVMLLEASARKRDEWARDEVAQLLEVLDALGIQSPPQAQIDMALVEFNCKLDTAAFLQSINESQETSA